MACKKIGGKSFTTTIQKPEPEAHCDNQCNLLIVWRGHIAFAFALHFAWNCIFFGRMVTRENAQVSETELFNLTLGNSTLATLLVTIAIALVFAIHKETLFGKTEIHR